MRRLKNLFRWIINFPPRSLRKDITYILVIANIFIYGYLYFACNDLYAQFMNPEIKVAEAKASLLPVEATAPEELLVAEKIIKICKENGLTKDEDIKWILGKLWNESKWKESNWGINKHKDGSVSLDRGIAMWNSLHHKEVSNECAFEMTCAITEMIKYRKDGKDIWWASDKL